MLLLLLLLIAVIVVVLRCWDMVQSTLLWAPGPQGVNVESLGLYCLHKVVCVIDVCALF